MCVESFFIHEHTYTKHAHNLYENLNHPVQLYKLLGVCCCCVVCCIVCCILPEVTVQLTDVKIKEVIFFLLPQICLISISNHTFRYIPYSSVVFWLGIKHQVTYLPSVVFLIIFSVFYSHRLALMFQKRQVPLASVGRQWEGQGGASRTRPSASCPCRSQRWWASRSRGRTEGSNPSCSPRPFLPVSIYLLLSASGTVLLLSTIDRTGDQTHPAVQEHFFLWVLPSARRQLQYCFRAS